MNLICIFLKRYIKLRNTILSPSNFRKNISHISNYFPYFKLFPIFQIISHISNEFLNLT